ncbi:IS3 family transposase [Desulfosporosinus sp. Sb-LF]|uniref:IS3 family transposase n=1 Tax=Desulfosporosinus sp. Sb-LF TaxID=2560027 RepID=UPI00107F0B99|nr:IS3 family transposase [Desulfosporosinus sp. Sb-LF]TGE34199.1 IS3 family transposase [Desulfosporosinus sp. Sb-LF]
MSPSVNYLAIYRHRDYYSITAMCKFFAVSRSGYYDFCKRIDKPDKDEPLAQMIQECQDRTGKTYGYRRVKIWLHRKKQLLVNHKAILRIMNKYGLLAEIRRRKKYKRMGEQLHKYENLLNREFKAAKPNQKWVTDISYIHTGQGTLYLSMIRDLFDESIIAHKVGTEQTVNLVLNTVKRLYKKKGSPKSCNSTVTKGFNTLQPGIST